MHLKYLLTIAFYFATVCGENETNNTTKLATKSANTNTSLPIYEGEKKSRKITSTDSNAVPVQHAIINLNATTQHNQLNSITKLTTTITTFKPIINATSTTKSTTTTTTTRKTTTTNTTTATTTTTTTPKPKPKKPLITQSVEELPDMMELLRKSNTKLQEEILAPIPPETEPVRDASAAPTMHTDMFVPLVTIMFTIPVAAGVIITTYRRFRECWTTRHYRRMDYLVDGMYND